MSLFVISDLHIWGTDDPLYQSLISLLKNRAVLGDTVILAGDLFDLFVGNKPIFKERYFEFFNAVASAQTRGIQVHYIEGNHDFLMKNAFPENGIQVHSKEVSIEIAGKRFYLAHGDLANRRAYGYRFLRFFLRSPLMRAFVALMPGSWVEKIGVQSSLRSRNRRPLLSSELSGKGIEKLRRIYRNYAAERLAQGYDFVVMGHCHDLDEMFFKVGDRQGQYVNVGFPRTHGSFLSWSPGEEKIYRERLP